MSNHFCPYCGAPVAGLNAHFCGNCGKALPAGMNDIPQMKKEADKISPEVKGTPASPVKEDASAATESAPGIPAEPENKPAVQENAEVQKKPAAEAHTESHFPDIAPEGAEPQQPASNPVIKEHTGPLPQPEIPYTPAFKHSKDDGFSDPSLRGMYFSFHGRLNSKRYFWRALTVWAVFLATGVGSIIAIGLFESLGLEFLMIPIILGMVILWIGGMIAGISLQIRRMQDLGWRRGAIYGYVAAVIAWIFIEPLFSEVVKSDPDSIWSMLLLLLGLFFFIVGLVFLFKKGTEGPNTYGPDPLEKTERNNSRI